MKSSPSFINRQGGRMHDCVRLDRLRLQGRLSSEAAPVRSEQLSAEPRRAGWFEAGGAGFGLRLVGPAVQRRLQPPGVGFWVHCTV